ncbi:MAG TPA: cupredoxin family copper-binding protein [Candidatus Nitrosocosmicus sp.]|nr:cupredoxin family copper-binding protein [Candidatus Nitrosocosmicus sp.]
MRTVDRFTRGSSRWGTLAAAAALGVMLGASTVAAGPPSRPVGTAGAGLTAAAATPATAPHIEIMKHRFSLPTVTVPVGATVTWVNHDDDAHTVVSTTALFRSPGLDTDDSYSYRFTAPGTYQYFCTLHPLMVGTVIVR